MTQNTYYTPENSELTMEVQAAHAATRLMFPRYSQLDPAWGFEAGTERNMCGVISTKAIIDFYCEQSGVETPSMDTLLQQINDAHGFASNGIQHAVEVDVLKSYGLVAWRRNWDTPSSNTEWFIDNEGYSDEQILAIEQQIGVEAAMDTQQQQELAAITASLDNDNPVIVSVKPGFTTNRANHQVVLVDYGATNDGDVFYVMDPVHETGAPLYVEPVEHFFDYFNHKAIFTKQ